MFPLQTINFSRHLKNITTTLNRSLYWITQYLWRSSSYQICEKNSQFWDRISSKKKMRFQVSVYTLDFEASRCLGQRYLRATSSNILFCLFFLSIGLCFSCVKVKMNGVSNIFSVKRFRSNIRIQFSIWSSFYFSSFVFFTFWKWQNINAPSSKANLSFGKYYNVSSHVWNVWFVYWY